MKTASTGLHHLVALEPSLHPFVREPEELGRLFGEKRNLEFLGIDPERRGLLKFSGDGVREVFSSFELDPASASYFLAIGSARGLKSNGLDREMEPLAAALTAHGLSPKRKRDAYLELTLPQNAQLLQGIFKSVSGLDLRVEAMPADPIDGDGYRPGKRYHDMLRISGRIADVSRGLRAVVMADGDDRAPRRDGPQRLANAYRYTGDPWNNEVTIQFRDEFGAFSTGRKDSSLPVIFWQRPGSLAYGSVASCEGHLKEPMNYGFRLICDGKEAHPFSSLGKLMQIADRMTSDMCKGGPVSMPEPSAEDLASARRLHSARINGSGGAGSRAVDAFLAENGIGRLPEREKDRPVRRTGLSR